MATTTTKSKPSEKTSVKETKSKEANKAPEDKSDAPEKKKMHVVETRGATYDFCPKAHFHERTKAEAKDSEDGFAGCPDCKTVWQVEEVEELSDEDKEFAKNLASAERKALKHTSQAEFDGNQASNFSDEEGANTTKNT